MPGRIFDTHKCVYILYLINAEIIYIVFRGIKIRHFIRSLRIIGFKTNAPYTKMYFEALPVNI